ncbi:MAG: TonB-dependent receptor [Bacteroidales bacterium]|nr:TonB-dependent receptor [Bacteroidales bacterium]
MAAILAALTAAAQTRGTATVSGYITDQASGETLIGAGVLVEGSGKKVQTGAVTNAYGYYTLTIPKGKTSLQYSYVGYESMVLALDLVRDTTLNIVLKPSAEIREATVVAQKDAGIQSTYLGSIDIPLVHIQKTPVLFGEADVLKAIQLMPGVQGGNEGFTGLYVRGGGPDENLILLDGVPIYNVDHMLGILSVFQTEAVKKVTLYKGSFPARYGGRVSSIVDIRTNDGNMKETHGSIGVGALTEKFHLEGPIIKDKLSYSLSARGLHTILFDPFIRFFGKRVEEGTEIYVNYFFYDLNGKITWRPTDKDRFFLASYNGRDQMGVKFTEDASYYSELEGFDRTKMGLGWGNNVVSLRWNHVFSSQLFANTTIAYNRYRMAMNSGMRSQGTNYDGVKYRYDFDIDYLSGIRDWSGKLDFDYVPSPRHLVKFGAEYLHHTFLPQTLTALTYAEEGNEKEKASDTYGNTKPYKGHDVSVYAEDDFSLTDRLTVNPGVHLSLFRTEGKNYWSLQPRLSAKYAWDGGWALKAGYARMAQYVHLLSSAQVSLPIDLWVPITKDIKPVTSDQFSAGVYYDGLKGWEFSVEGYYKSMHNILEYKDGTVMVATNSGWETRVEMGNGRAMGLEFFAQKTTGKATGWIAYTLAKSDRQFPDGTINLGERFPYKYDRRHNFNINVNYQVTPRIDLSATFVFATGGTTTLPVRQTGILAPGRDYVQNADFVEHRNNYRLPPSHHLNVGANFHKRKRHGERIWTLGIYNVYRQLNPNLVFLHYETTRPQPDAEPKTRLVMEKVTILPFVPSVSYTYQF